MEGRLWVQKERTLVWVARNEKSRRMSTGGLTIRVSPLQHCTGPLRNGVSLRHVRGIPRAAGCARGAAVF
jgi:hypothetical protein